MKRATKNKDRGVTFRGWNVTFVFELTAPLGLSFDFLGMKDEGQEIVTCTLFDLTLFYHVYFVRDFILLKKDYIAEEFRQLYLDGVFVRHSIEYCWNTN